MMNEHAKHTLADKLRERKNTSVDTSPHLIVEARAGTGKTTTGIEGLRIVLGGVTKLIPSPQQAAVWKAMAQSKGFARTVCFVAFSKAIATELQQRVPKGCQASTLHSMGYTAVWRRYGYGLKLNQDRVQDIIAELLGKDIWELRRDRPTLLKATKDLVSLCKMTLADGGACWDKQRAGEYADDVLTNLAAHYDIDLNGESRKVFDLVPRVLERCKDVEKDNCIDFDDMIWLPVVLNLPVYKYDLLCVDEAQDLNRCQQALAMKAGRRLVLFGDPRQAIFGFAGANSQSMERMYELLGGCEGVPRLREVHQNISHLKGEDPPISIRGCITLPLTVTRRCGRAIVEEAKKIVPDFEAHESCGEGHVWRARFGNTEYAPPDNESLVDIAPDTRTVNYQTYVSDGDMVLCRVNAPLVSECFKFLKGGRKANIQGRDVGQGLVSTVKRMKANTVQSLCANLGAWLIQEEGKEQAKRNPSEARLIALQDRVDCIYCFAEGAKTVDKVIQKIEAVFADDKNGRGIMLSSIHKAKGLEAERVFLLEPEGATVPHPMASSAWQRKQEMNLRYVAITRAISELIYVS